jgi:hypothetical protein
MMSNRFREGESYGKKVVEHVEYESQRTFGCMCLHCKKLKPGKEDNCPAAQAFYEICKEHGCAFILTRCGAGFEETGGPYRRFKNEQ